MATAALLLWVVAFPLVLRSQSPASGPAGLPPSDAQGSYSRRIFRQQVPPKSGEVCQVCNKPIGPDDIVYLVDGQRIPVHRADCDARLQAQPRKYLAKMKPRGALLDATSVSSTASNDWLYFGLFMLAGLVFGALAAHRAFRVGRRPFVWLVLGMLGNLPAYVLLLALPKCPVQALAGIPAGIGKIAATYAPQTCPKCGAENHPSARECTGCGATLNPAMESEAARVGLQSA